MFQTLQEIDFSHDLADFLCFGTLNIDSFDGDKAPASQIQRPRHNPELAFANAISELLEYRCQLKSAIRNSAISHT